MRDEVAVQAGPVRPRQTLTHLRDTPAPIAIESRHIAATS